MNITSALTSWQTAEARVRACRAFGNPSYYVQALFAEHQGVLWAQTSVKSQAAQDNGIAASATCADRGCTRLSLKVRTSLSGVTPRAAACISKCDKTSFLVQRLRTTTGCCHTRLHGIRQYQRTPSTLLHNTLPRTLPSWWRCWTDQTMLMVQLVNYAAFPQTVTLSILSSPSGLGGPANVTTLAAAGPYVTNSFDTPSEVSEHRWHDT